MPIISIELSDVGIRAASGNGRNADLLALDGQGKISPAYALVHKRKIITGIAASAEARKQPRQICTNYWENLSTQPVADTALAQFTYADLAFAHLEEVWRQVGSPSTEVILAVPGHFDKTRLGLILGIGHEINMSICKIVDMAALSCLDGAQRGENIIHVDVHMHSVVITVLAARMSLGRSKVKTLNGGWAGLKNQLVKTLSKKFVKDTRFDPMHSAESEQAIFDQIDGLLKTLAVKSLSSVEMRVNGQDLTIPISIDEISEPHDLMVNDICVSVSEEIDDPENTRVMVTDRAARVPGLYRQLKTFVTCGVERMPEAAAACAGILHSEYFKGDGTESGVGFITSLPLDENTQPEDLTSIMTMPKPTPTHLLVKSQAHRLSSDRLIIGWDGHAALVGDMSEACQAGELRLTAEGCLVKALNGRSLLLNGVQLTHPSQVLMGDRICIDDTPAEFIAIATA